MVSLGLNSWGQVVPIDKQKHFAAGFVVGSMSATDTRAKHPFWNAVLFSTMAGVGKEVMDIGTGVPEVNDVLFTVTGGIVGGGITYWIRKRIENQPRVAKIRKYKRKRKKKR